MVGGGNGQTTGSLVSSIFTSSDGNTWASQSNHLSYVNKVKYANGLWVVGGWSFSSIGSPANPGSTIQTSTDGSNWTLRTNPLDQMIVDIEYGNGLWIGIPDLQVFSSIIKSTDGITWTAQNNIPLLPSRVAYGNSKWVLGGGNFVGNTTSQNTMAYSSDATAWTAVNTNFGRITSIMYDNNIWLAGGDLWGAASSGTIQASTDAITWTVTSSLTYSPGYYGQFDVTQFQYLNGTWIASLAGGQGGYPVGNSTFQISYDNGSNWGLISFSNFVANRSFYINSRNIALAVGGDESISYANVVKKRSLFL